MAIETKFCPKCTSDKSRDDFTNDRNRKDGKYPYCKVCRAKDFAALKTPEWQAARTASNRAYREGNAERLMWLSAKRRAARRGVAFTIQPEDVVIPERCPVLGIELVIAKGRFNENSPSLDRKDPLKGYVPGNVSVISFRANLIKNDATAEELEKVLNWMRT